MKTQHQPHINSAVGCFRYYRPFSGRWSVQWSFKGPVTALFQSMASLHLIAQCERRVLPLATAVYHVGAREGQGFNSTEGKTADHVISNKSCISSSTSDFHLLYRQVASLTWVMCHVAEIGAQPTAVRRTPQPGSWPVRFPSPGRAI